MDFLNKARNQSNKMAETTNTVAKPLSKPTPPGIENRPQVGARPPVGNKPPGAVPTLNKPTPPVGNRPAVGGFKPVMPKRPDIGKIEEVKEEVKANLGPTAKAANPFIINKDVAKAPVPVKAKEEVAVEPIVDSAEVNEPVKEEKTETKKKPTGKGSRKKVAEKKETTEDMSEEEIEVVIPKTEVSYAEAVLSIKSTFIDEEWEEFRESTSVRLGEIQLSNDMTPGSLKQTISDLNALRDSVWVHFLDCKTLFENLTAKDDGLLDRIKRINSKGANDNERKINAAVAIMNYKEGGKAINLYEILDASRSRFNYTKGLMEAIQYKSNAVISMLGNLKLEK